MDFARARSYFLGLPWQVSRCSKFEKHSKSFIRTGKKESRRTPLSHLLQEVPFDFLSADKKHVTHRSGTRWTWTASRNQTLFNPETGVHVIQDHGAM